MQERLTVGLFASSAKGVRLLGQSQDPKVVETVRAQLLEDRRAELERLEPERPPNLRPIRGEGDGGE